MRRRRRRCCAAMVSTMAADRSLGVRSASPNSVASHCAMLDSGVDLRRGGPAVSAGGPSGAAEAPAQQAIGRGGGAAARGGRALPLHLAHDRLVAAKQPADALDALLPRVRLGAVRVGIVHDEGHKPARVRGSARQGAPSQAAPGWFWCAGARARRGGGRSQEEASENPSRDDHGLQQAEDLYAQIAVPACQIMPRDEQGPQHCARARAQSCRPPPLAAPGAAACGARNHTYKHACSIRAPRKPSVTNHSTICTYSAGVIQRRLRRSSGAPAGCCAQAHWHACGSGARGGARRP